jgi:hypothetical protein
MSVNEVKEKSGIEDMKEKIRKKLTLDDMGPVHTAVHTAIQPAVNSDLQHQIKENITHPANHTAVHPTVNTAINNKPQYNRKVTLYLTEEMYKAFNDIYAQRMLDNRKTDKSVLICEAIKLLYEKETKDKE